MVLCRLDTFCCVVGVVRRGLWRFVQRKTAPLHERSMRFTAGGLVCGRMFCRALCCEWDRSVCICLYVFMLLDLERESDRATVRKVHRQKVACIPYFTAMLGEFTSGARWRYDLHRSIIYTPCPSPRTLQTRKCEMCVAAAAARLLCSAC